MRDWFSRAWPSLVALFGTLAVVAVLLYFFGDSGGTGDGDDNQAEATETPTGSPSPDDEPTDEPTDDPTDEPDAEPTTAPPELISPVGVLNSTGIANLAASAQMRLEDGGWEVPAIADYNGSVEETTVYYPDESLRESAEALAAQFPEIGAVEPTIPGLATDRLVVILGEDYVDEVGEPEL